MHIDPWYSTTACVPYDKRECIVELWLEKYSQCTVLKVMERLLKTVKAYKSNHHIKDGPRKPRCQATSHAEDLAIVDAVADRRRGSVQDIKTNLVLNALNTTVKHRLYQAQRDIRQKFSWFSCKCKQQKHLRGPTLHG